MLELNRELRKIGMNIFIKYFFHIKDKPEIEIFKKEKFTKKSKQSRLNAGKNIFKKGWEKEALEVVISSRASEETINLATEIYLQLFPGETPRTIRFVRPEFMFGKQIVEKLFSIAENPNKNFRRYTIGFDANLMRILRRFFGYKIFNFIIRKFTLK